MVTLTLDELAIKNGTDKGTTSQFASTHGYAPIYEKYLSDLRDKNIRMLEIGVCMEFTQGGQSVRMWYEYFQQAEIYTFDIVDMKGLENELPYRVRFFKGDQSSRDDLNNMYTEFGSKPFDLIIEDGSHIHEHQIISLGHLFPYVKSGGYYILEDVTEEDVPVCCIRNDETLKYIKKLKEDNVASSELLTKEESAYLEKHISKIEIYPDIQNAYRTIIIHKK
jgi:demethylmacrocin O-methyltransferase